MKVLSVCFTYKGKHYEVVRCLDTGKYYLYDTSQGIYGEMGEVGGVHLDCSALTEILDSLED